jgi:hypothetical protein
MTVRSSTSILGLCLVTAAAGLLSPAMAQQWVMSRTPDGHPDLQGTWSNATMTPFQRRPGQGPVYTPEEVAQREQGFVDRVARGSAPSDPNRPAPPAGRDVGSYNQVWFEQGDRVAVVNGEPRTSLITYPANGRIPMLTAEGQERKDEYHGFRSQFGEYDHPELRPLADRCIVYYASSPTATLGPPMTPSGGYNNNIRVIQTADYVVIHGEMVHDTRIIRLGEPNRLPAHIRPWFGDSWGRWEGNTLVVETTNIHPDMGFNELNDKIPNSEDLMVVERLTRIDEDNILYEFEVQDPRTYTEVWGGQIPWRAFDQQIYEYACHEGNYSLSNVLSGARYQERQAEEDRH